MGRYLPSEALAQADQYSSIYDDIRHHLEQLTRPTDHDGDQQPGINLVFLVDDLDRCLPDKTVQMLEAIKLFLDIPGCAFLLGVDEEVVDRGIAYRYKDYRRSDDTHEDGANCPITGHEYLEKIVHLPFHCRRWNRWPSGIFCWPVSPTFSAYPKPPAHRTTLYM